MVNLTLYFAFYITMKLRSHERILWVPACYISMATVLWAVAFYFYVWRATSWHETPARSREFNSRCILFNFYDSHDIWHFLSSMSLFFSLMTMLTLDDDLVEVPRDTIYVF
ncbi:SID1 transmembrane family member 1 [Lamellibrachia satsuma]|nr:SID1 transmembrane family member 1 [Lamellibrachia satsuma]